MNPNMSKLDALVAKIKADVEVRRRPGGSVAVETSKTRAARDKRERGSDPALSALMRQSNLPAWAPKPDPYKHFHEVARTSILQKQVCRCCEGEQVNVVAEMLHLRGRSNEDAPVADVWVRRSSTQPLPHEEPMWAPAHSVEFCADCITTAGSTSCWGSPQLLPEATGQLPLIH